MHQMTELFIGGRWQAPSSPEVLEVLNPATEEVIGRAAVAHQADVDAAVAAARQALPAWAALPVSERLDHMSRFADEIDKLGPQIADVLIAETGFPSAHTRFEAGQLSTLLRHNVGLAGRIAFAERRTGASGAQVEIRREPVGVVAAIAAWNAPHSLAGNKIAPALLAGCTVVLKPAEQTSLDSRFIAEAAERAGLPPGVVNVVTGDAATSACLVGHPHVDKVAFTGSSAVGQRIASAASAHLTRVSLELGGKSAAIVADDADLDVLVATIPPALLTINGEMCVAISRLLVSEAREQEITSALSAAFERVVVGDPTDERTQLGPMISAAHRDRVLGYVRGAVADGARIATGGGIPASMTRGFYVQPTILADVEPQSQVAQEEIFGPVLAVIRYRDLDDAVRIANDTSYGLSGAVYSADPATASRLASELRCGSVHINNGMNVDIDVPFGGFKSSGYGREYGPEGVQEYTEPKVVFLDSAVAS
jgi:aldehyde dehydrogenase (NAD+)